VNVGIVVVFDADFDRVYFAFNFFLNCLKKESYLNIILFFFKKKERIIDKQFTLGKEGKLPQKRKVQKYLESK